LPAEFGNSPIIMSSAGGLGAILKPIEKFDPILLASVKNVVRPGDVVWDVGANIGLFSVAAAALAGRQGKMFSFEPDTVLVQLLRRTACLQSGASAPMTIVPCAIAKAFGVRRFSVAKRARASNALFEYGHSQMGGVEELQTVVAVGLDDLARTLPAPDVLKIDVEGAEIEALVGGAELLRSSRPSIVCEISAGNSSKATALLRKVGYLLYDASKPFNAAARIDLATWNTIALPEEKSPPSPSS